MKGRTIIIIGAFMFFAGVPWSLLGMQYVSSWYDETLPTQDDQQFYFGILEPLYSIFFFGGIIVMIAGVVFWKMSKSKTGMYEKSSI